MARSDAFFGLLFERHGTGITLANDPVKVHASVSFFEAELLNASMTRKPILIAQARELRPSVALEEFLRHVSGSLNAHIIKVDRSSLCEVFEDYCRNLVNPNSVKTVWLYDAVSVGRIKNSIKREQSEPELSFLGGVLRRDGDRAPDQTVIAAALRRVDGGLASDGRPLGQLDKLSYLWIVLKELARATASDRTHEFGGEAERVLELWNASAAWYGLHGSHPMGCLAALNELTHVRIDRGSGNVPLGPRSSAYYSIGAQMRSKRNARQFFRQSLALSHAALDKSPTDPSGLLQMVASANARLASLGEPWRYFRALDGFRNSYDWRVRHSQSDVAIGEAMNSYAHALFRLPWRRREALRLAEEASPLLLSSRDGIASGFYLRAERKRAEMLRQAGRFDEALAVALRARDLAQEAQAFDQERQLEVLINDWTGQPAIDPL